LNFKCNHCVDRMIPIRNIWMLHVLTVSCAVCKKYSRHWLGKDVGCYAKLSNVPGKEMKDLNESWKQSELLSKAWTMFGVNYLILVTEMV